MIPRLALCLLAALLQQTFCQVIVSSSSSRDTGSVPPPGLPLYSLEPPQQTRGTPLTVRWPEGHSEGSPTGGGPHWRAGPEVEKEHPEEEQEIHPSSGSEGMPVGRRRDKDLDVVPALAQSQTREEGGSVVGGPDLASSSADSSLDSRSVGNVAVSRAASPTPASEGSVSEAGQPQVGHDVHSAATTQSPGLGQGTSPLASFFMPHANPSSERTVSTVAGEQQGSVGEVEPGAKEEMQEGDVAGSGDGPFSAVVRAESSTLARPELTDAPARVRPQAWTYTAFATTPKGPTSSTVTRSSQVGSTTASPPIARAQTGPADTNISTPTSTTAGKQSAVSRDGKGQLHTTRPRLAEDKHATSVRWAPTAGTTMTTTEQMAKTGLSPQTSSSPLLHTNRTLGPKLGRAFEKNASVLAGGAGPGASCVSEQGPCSTPTAPNGTLLLWGDLRQTLTFAWELHVYGTAVLFLLLAGGALVGLLLWPSLSCPYPGCLALANALLMLVGVLRSILFFLDPYGAREVLPRTGVTALYNLPLALLLWAQVSLGLLVLQVAGLWRLVPPSLQRLPLAAVLAVLHCTVLLAADLLSAALSPAVPAVLQTLSLCWGFILCLGFLLYAFPQTQRPPEAEGGARAGGLQGVRVLGRVLAVCACLGVPCCGLHIHATLWLYGWLGHWRSFSWAWWLVHFWARLLELAWASFMLLLASWVFWRPRAREERAGEGTVGPDPPSSSSSSCSLSHRHPCWAKIVHSLRGRPCRKPESSGAGEVPNNWAGQERPGADISKSLIRNRDQAPGSRCVKDSNRGRNQKGSTGSLMRLQSMGCPPQRSMSSSLDRDKEWVCDKESALSLADFDLRPPSPIDLSRSIDEALHREHLLYGAVLFPPLAPPSPPSRPSHHHPLASWLRRSSEPQINLSESGGLAEGQSGRTEQSDVPGGSTRDKQATAPTSPTHQSHMAQQDRGAPPRVPTSISCPVSFRAYRTPVPIFSAAGDDTKPFLTPDSEAERAGADLSQTASRGYLEVSRQEDSASVSSDIIDL